MINWGYLNYIFEYLVSIKWVGCVVYLRIF